MYEEFCITKDLQHENIVNYKYFMRSYVPETQKYDCHIIMELLEGGDLENYLRDFGRPFDIEKVRQIGA